ncbi:TRAP transporter small permease [Bosea sp. NPDC003192]|uniref:TRAP transporter small permease n=1 Tax=Bosea sp. NPDC003192 TaxID=3390551 RepID=UPI003D01022A
MAITGGLVMVGIVGMSLISLLGRKLWASPILGDVEIVQMLAAPALACFFAFCHLSNGDVRVGIIADQLGPAWSRRLDALGSLLLGLVAALIAWRTAAGAVALHESGETSALLSWPIWLSQALVVPGFALQAAAGLYLAARPFIDDRSGA